MLSKYAGARSINERAGFKSGVTRTALRINQLVGLRGRRQAGGREERGGGVEEAGCYFRAGFCFRFHLPRTRAPAVYLATVKYNLSSDEALSSSLSLVQAFGRFCLFIASAPTDCVYSRSRVGISTRCLLTPVPLFFSPFLHFLDGLWALLRETSIFRL